jgi:glycosyltransferase involved in cell wall biosynthesis
MKISLVMGTLGARSDRLGVFLDSLASATHRDIELVVVDQSQGDGALPDLLSKPRLLFPVLHLRSQPGLSRARNVGLAAVTGDVVAFPDDDSWYPKTLLASVVQRFGADTSLGGLAGRPIDAEGHSSFPRWDLRPGPVNRFNVWRRCNSNALFLTRAAVERVGGFDESLGLGSGTPWGSAEDIDYPLRILASGLNIYYDPTLLVHHPRTTPGFDSAGAARAESYGRGMGRVLRKHGYPWWFVLYQGARPLGGALISAATGRLAKARYHRAILRGRRQGFSAPRA